MIGVACILMYSPGRGETHALNNFLSGKQCSALNNSPVCYCGCLRNNRIRSELFLDQHCAFSDDFEPMLLARKHWSFLLRSQLRLTGTILPAATINRNTAERVQSFDFA
jgi:hypothetical protein